MARLFENFEELPSMSLYQIVVGLRLLVTAPKNHKPLICGKSTRHHANKDTTTKFDHQFIDSINQSVNFPPIHHQLKRASPSIQRHLSQSMKYVPLPRKMTKSSRQRHVCSGIGTSPAMKLLPSNVPN
jgi:hypothetical protein